MMLRHIIGNMRVEEAASGKTFCIIEYKKSSISYKSGGMNQGIRHLLIRYTALFAYQSMQEKLPVAGSLYVFCHTFGRRFYKNPPSTPMICPVIYSGACTMFHTIWAISLGVP